MELLQALDLPDESGLILKLLGTYVPLELISGMLGSLGFEEDLPESKKHLNYGHLSLQSKRIVNRLIKYLRTNKTTAEAFLKAVTIQ